MSCLKGTTKELVVTAANSLPGFKLCSDETAAFTHLVIDDDTRTLKALFALARGAWVVRSSWVLRSLEAGKWVGEQEHEAGYLPGFELSKDHKGRLLQGMRVCVLPGTCPEPVVLKELLLAAGAKVSVSSSACNLCIAPPDTDLGGQADEAVTAVVPMWLLDSLSEGQLADTTDYLVSAEYVPCSPNY